MKRRSRSSPPSTRRPHTASGISEPFTADLARDQRQRDFPGVSPESVQKVLSFRKQLFQMINTRAIATNSSLSDPEHDDSHPVPSGMDHATPPEQLIVDPNNLIEQAVHPRQRQQQQQERDPTDLQDVLTQQTEVLAGVMVELRARQPAVQQANPAEPPVDPAFSWGRLALLYETKFQVPAEGLVQGMASSLFSKVPTLAGRDQYEARFVLQVISLWPDSTNKDRVWAFRRLNVYCIVAALGWPAATAAHLQRLLRTSSSLQA